MAPGESWGAIAPLGHTGLPRRKVKNYPSEIIGICSTLKTIFWLPRRNSQPPSENSWGERRNKIELSLVLELLK